MRWYDTVSGILVVLSIIDFALAAPLPLQEKLQACTDMMHIPHNAVTMLGKRGDEEIVKIVEDFFGTWKYPIGSDAHLSSDSAPPPEPNHESTNVAHAYNPGLIEPSSSSSVQGAWGNPLSEDRWPHPGVGELHGSSHYTPASS